MAQDDEFTRIMDEAQKALKRAEIVRRDPIDGGETWKQTRSLLDEMHEQTRKKELENQKLREGLAESIVRLKERIDERSLRPQQPNQKILKTPKLGGRRHRGEVDTLAAYRGLQKKTELGDFYFRGLTELQEVCGRLKWEYGLSDAKIAKRVGRAKSTVQECLKAALTRINSRFINDSRRAKRRRPSSIDRNELTED